MSNNDHGLTAYITVTHYCSALDSILTATYIAPANWASEDAEDVRVRLVNAHPGRLPSTDVNGRTVFTKYAVADALGLHHRHIASIGDVEIKSR